MLPSILQSAESNKSLADGYGDGNPSANNELGLPTASQAILAWYSDIDSPPAADADHLSDILAADQPTAFEVAKVWQRNDEDSSHPGSLVMVHSPTGFDAAALTPPLWHLCP